MHTHLRSFVICLLPALLAATAACSDEKALEGANGKAKNSENASLKRADAADVDQNSKDGDDSSVDKSDQSDGGDDDETDKNDADDDGDGNDDDSGENDTGSDDDSACAFVENPDDFTSVKIAGGPSSLKYDLSHLLDGATWDGNTVKFDFYAFQYGNITIAETVSGMDVPDSMTQMMSPFGGAEWSIERPTDFSGRTYQKMWFKGVIKNARSGKCKLTATMVPKSMFEIMEERIEHMGGCFDAETKIRLADGTDKRVSELTYSDKVWNPKLGRAFSIGKMIKGPETRNGMIEVGIGDRRVVVTTMHPFHAERGMIAASEITKADRLLDVDGQFRQVTHLVRRQPDATQVVYNLTLKTLDQDPAAHMVLANGVVTGDLFMQQRLQASRAMASADSLSLPQRLWTKLATLVSP